jgi:glutamate-1-semialdehyde 2,1-aminomutase
MAGPRAPTGARRALTAPPPGATVRTAKGRTHRPRDPTAMTDDFARATPGSLAAWTRASARVPGGVSSNVRYFAPHPVFMDHAAGARLWDVDGREYLDYCLAFGPLVAGHGHPRVHEAVVLELERAGTTIFGTPTVLELAMAERLARLLPSAEMVRFTNSGTEATMHAIRIARGATGRSRIIKFEGHYHGVHDAVLFNLDRPLPQAPANDGIPASTHALTTVLPFNDIAALEAAFENPRDVAAVIVEPVARGVIQPDPAFLERLRQLTRRHGAVLVFDEVVAWPRVGLSGAQGLYGVVPDLTTLGKALGGGLPLAAVAGTRAVMETVVPRPARTTGVGPYVFHGGTYNGTPVALAAGHAVLDLLEDRDTWTRWQALGELLRSGITRVCRAKGIDVQVLGRGAVADFYFTAEPIVSSRQVWTSDLARRRAVDCALLAAGVFNAPLHRWHLSTAHTSDDVAWSLERLAEALEHV